MKLRQLFTIAGYSLPMIVAFGVLLWVNSLIARSSTPTPAAVVAQLEATQPALKPTPALTPRLSSLTQRDLELPTPHSVTVQQQTQTSAQAVETTTIFRPVTVPFRYRRGDLSSYLQQGAKAQAQANALSTTTTKRLTTLDAQRDTATQISVQ